MSGLRVAAFSEIHGNIWGLNALIAEVEQVQPDFILGCEYVATKPFPIKTLIRLMNLGKRAQFVRGNTNLEIISAYSTLENQIKS